MKPFSAPEDTLGDLRAADAANVIGAAADIALVLDEGGIIRDFSLQGERLPAEVSAEWLGQSWSETVTVESKPKIEALLRDASPGEATGGRQVNHPSPSGVDVPVVYSAVRVRENDRVVAVGRDLSDLADLQDRVVKAQQSMERDYLRLRQVEARYRLLFHMLQEALMVVDAVTFRIVETSPAVGPLLGGNRTRVTGQLLEAFDAESTRALQTLFAGVSATGRGDDIEVASKDGARRFRLSASPFRQDGASMFLVRLAPASADDGPPAPTEEHAQLLSVMEQVPDGVVATDSEGRVLSANAAFLELAQLTTESQARGEPIGRWLGRPGVDFHVLKANLRQHGSVRLFSTNLHGEHSAEVPVEVSAVSVTGGDGVCFGFSIRDVGRRLGAETDGAPELPRSVEELTELVTRVPLKDLVRETTDVIEKLCIEAALRLTGDNRASAAEMLGVSRQSLYAKLRRYGLGDLDADDRASGRTD